MSILQISLEKNAMGFDVGQASLILSHGLSALKSMTI